MRTLGYGLLRGGLNGLQVAFWGRPRLLLPPGETPTGGREALFSRVAAPETSYLFLATLTGGIAGYELGGPELGPQVAGALMASQAGILALVFGVVDRFLAAELIADAAARTPAATGGITAATEHAPTARSA